MVFVENEIENETKQPSKVFFEKSFSIILHNSQENMSDGVSFFKKSHRPEACNSMKKETPTQMFPLNFAKILRRPFLENISYVTVYDSTEFDGEFFPPKY